MYFPKLSRLPVAFLFSAILVRASGISYTCDPTVAAATCTTLNTTIAGLYNRVFSNANADIYIQYGTTGLGQSTTGFTNQISYSTYINALQAEAGPGTLRADAIASLPATEPALYGGAPIDITSALGTALGITGLNGTTAGGAICTVGTSGCYNGIITITNDPSTLLYYRNGAIDPAAYDFYSVVEHETDEVLGTSSCIGTTGPSLANGCSNNAASAVDLYRFNGGSRVFLDDTPGAYFSYDGGVTNGADGALYNTLANGNDYADFISGCPATPLVQDGTACPGFAGLDITNDGGAEIRLLDAVGYNLTTTSAVPEPTALWLFGAGLPALAIYQRRRSLLSAYVESRQVRQRTTSQPKSN
jgi:hypothetical protein